MTRPTPEERAREIVTNSRPYEEFVYDVVTFVTENKAKSYNVAADFILQKLSPLLAAEFRRYEERIEGLRKAFKAVRDKIEFGESFGIDSTNAVIMADEFLKKDEEENK